MLANLSDRYSGTRLFTVLNIKDFSCLARLSARLSHLRAWRIGAELASQLDPVILRKRPCNYAYVIMKAFLYSIIISHDHFHIILMAVNCILTDIVTYNSVCLHLTVYMTIAVKCHYVQKQVQKSPLCCSSLTINIFSPITSIYLLFSLQHYSCHFVHSLNWYPCNTENCICIWGLDHILQLTPF